MRPLTISQILESFPQETRTIAPREVRRIRKELKVWEEYFTSLYKQPYDDFTKWFISEVIRICYMPREKLKHLERLKKLIRISKIRSNKKGISEKDIQVARDTPITSLIECNKRGKKHWANCPFHYDKTPSLCINENNTAKCFSCGFFGDSIEITKKMNGMSFIEAIKYLINLN